MNNKYNLDRKQYQDEFNNTAAQLQNLEQQKNLLSTRLVELQGVIKYLDSQIKKEKEEEKSEDKPASTSESKIKINK